MSRFGLFGLGICLVGARVAMAQPDVAHLPPIELGSVTVRLEPLVTGLNTPTDLASSRDGSGRLFVADLFGRVNLIKGDTLQATPFLDVSGTTDTGPFSGWGLTSLAFHPDFANPESVGHGKLYTVRAQPAGTAPAHFNPAGTLHQSVVEEWQVSAADPDVIDVGSRREILRLNQDGTEHAMNQAIFGPDGMLYVSFGDGGNSPPGHQFYAQRARQLNNPFGKILRIDVDDPDAPVGGNGRYAVPQDNPFVGQAGALGEIYATGFRNPYRMSFDRATGELYLGDVGQVSIEEVNRVAAGGNYGWNLKEGSFKYDYNTQHVSPDDDGTAQNNSLIDPLGEYDHTQGRSVTGGFVYRGSLLPELIGKYVFGELGWSSGGAKLFYMDTASGEISQFPLDPMGTQTNGFFLYGFGEDANNELYLVGRSGGAASDTGMVVQLLAEAYAWAVDAGGEWSSSANWSRGSPDAVDAAAVLGGVISEARQVVLDAPVTLGSLRFDGEHGYELRGPAALTIDVSPGRTGQLSATGAAEYVVAAPLTIADDTTVTVVESAATLALRDLAQTASRITKRGEGTLEVNRLRAGALNVEAGTVRIAPGGGTPGDASFAGQLTLAGEAGAWTGTLDLTDNDLIIGGENTAETLARVIDQVRQARDGGDDGQWSGTGITSSAAAADPVTGIAIVMMPGSGNIVLKHTYNGDANLDGVINFDDYFRIDSSYLEPPANPTYDQGDFNYDGVINFDDYFLIDSAFLGQGGPLGSGPIAPASVPEPGGLIAVIAMAGVAARRRWGR